MNRAIQNRHRNFHVPIPEELYQALRGEAERRGQPATRLVRALLEQWEQRSRAERLHGEIADYAARHAGTSADLDSQLEAAGIDTLVGEQKPSRRKRKSK